MFQLFVEDPNSSFAEFPVRQTANTQSLRTPNSANTQRPQTLGGVNIGRPQIRGDHKHRAILNLQRLRAPSKNRINCDIKHNSNNTCNINNFINDCISNTTNSYIDSNINSTIVSINKILGIGNTNTDTKSNSITPPPSPAPSATTSTTA